MGAEKVKSPAGYCKIGILILGIVIMGVGLHSHFESNWKKANLYKLCDMPAVTDCPAISLEQYFVAIVIISFILSIVSLIAMVLLDMGSGALKMVDVGYHGVIGVLLLIGAICYFVSARQISKDVPSEAEKILKLLTAEKYAAGALAVLQSILYGFTAFLLLRS